MPPSSQLSRITFFNQYSSIRQVRIYKIETTKLSFSYYVDEDCVQEDIHEPAVVGNTEITYFAILNLRWTEHLLVTFILLYNVSNSKWKRHFRVVFYAME